MFKNRVINLNLFFIKIFSFLLIFNLNPSQAMESAEEAKINLDTTYLESKGELNDYILDTGDVLNIKFIDLPEMSHMILNGHNENEVSFLPKNSKKLGFFEKFFQLFS